MAVTWKKIAYEDDVVTKALLTTEGDIIYASGASTPARLGIGNNGQVLTLAAGIPSWAALGAPGAHKDTHDPADGSDPLDTAAPAELAGVQAAGAGSAHSLARSDHAHQIQHSIADNHLVTIDSTANQPVNTDYAKFTANGLEGKDKAGVLSDLNVADGADVTGSNAPQAHKASHQDTGGDEISIAGLAGESAELATHKAVKAANATLGHVIVETASLIDVDGDGKLTLGAHASTHKNGGSDEILLHELGEPTSAVPFAGQQATDLVLENSVNNPAAPVVGKIYFKIGDTAAYLCTAAA